jgi:hypothetical protein
MANEKAKRAILQEWNRWIKTQPGLSVPTGRDAFKFFLELKSANSSLLGFRSHATDKWQIIHGWLLNGGHVTD